MRVNLLEGNIVKSLAKLALPLMGMSFLQMAYNLIDMIWIGKLGAEAVAAVGTGGILIWFSTGIHTLAQLGGQVYVAQNLGAGDMEKAGKFAHGAIVLSLSITITLGLIFMNLTTPIIGYFNLGDATVILNAEQYLKITGGFICFMLMSKLLTALVATTGDSKTPLKATAIGLIFNIILDPILIFGLFGFPTLGVKGAAIATVLAQIIVFTMLFLHAKADTHLFCYVKLFQKPDINICKAILRLSFPTAVQATIFPMISIYLSRLVAGFGYNGIAVQRVGSQIESLSWLTTDGFAIAVNSFIAQNYGAGNFKRAKEGFKKAVMILGIYGVCVTFALIYFAKPLFQIFLTEPEVVVLGTSYLAILGISQMFVCLEILSTSSLNAFGRTMIPAVIGISFTALRIPLAMFLSSTELGLDGIWWSVTISSMLKGTFLLTAILIFLYRYEHKRINKG